MSHPDDGTIQALLDGELEPTEQAQFEAHVASCAACAARVREAREFLQEAERLVEVLAVPVAGGGESVRPASIRRRFPLRTLAWAASIVMAVGIGYYGRGVPTPASDARQEGEALARAATPSTTPTAGSPVDEVSPPTSKERDRNEAVRNAPAAAAPGTAMKQAAEAPAEAEAKVAAPPPRAAEPSLKDNRADQAALGAARLADEAGPTWRVISMEEGVRLLDGQIRLIDGMSPDRVESGPGTLVAGADPGQALVRIVYASGNVVLDQQRPPTRPSARREDAAAPSAAERRQQGAGWQDREGIRFVVTGTVSSDSIRELTSRVR